MDMKTMAPPDESGAACRPEPRDAIAKLLIPLAYGTIFLAKGHGAGPLALFALSRFSSSPPWLWTIQASLASMVLLAISAVLVTSTAIRIACWLLLSCVAALEWIYLFFWVTERADIMIVTTVPLILIVVMQIFLYDLSTFRRHSH